MRFVLFFLIQTGLNSRKPFSSDVCIAGFTGAEDQ